MYREDEDDTRRYKVVINHDEQYSLWPANRENPVGWFDVDDQSGTKQECLDTIQQLWTDIRPLRLRQRMAENARQRSVPRLSPAPAPTPATTPLDPLVQRLSSGNHPLIASRVNGSVAALQQSIARRYVLIKFLEIQGGLELGVRLDDRLTDLSQADFEQATGIVHLVGNLTLNDVNVRCRADIDLATWQGTGHLEPVEA